MFDAGAVPDYWVILFFAVVIVEEIVQRHSVRILLTLIQVWGNKKKRDHSRFGTHVANGACGRVIASSGEDYTWIKRSERRFSHWFVQLRLSLEGEGTMTWMGLGRRSVVEDKSPLSVRQVCA